MCCLRPPRLPRSFGWRERRGADGHRRRHITGTGMMVGTPGYMHQNNRRRPGRSPHGYLPFGALAYELLTGSPPFAGTPQQVVAAQLTRSPEPIARQRPDTPPPLASLVMRCLQKDPGDRWQRTDDLLAVLESVPTTGIEVSAHRRSSKSRVNYAAIALVAIASLAAAWYAVRAMRAAPSLAIGQITRVTSEPGLELDPALSPDGQTIAYAGRNGSYAHLRQAAHRRPDRAADRRELR